MVGTRKVKQGGVEVLSVRFLFWNFLYSNLCVLWPSMSCCSLCLGLHQFDVSSVFLPKAKLGPQICGRGVALSGATQAKQRESEGRHAFIPDAALRP